MVLSIETEKTLNEFYRLQFALQFVAWSGPRDDLLQQAIWELLAELLAFKAGFKVVPPPVPGLLPTQLSSLSNRNWFSWMLAFQDMDAGKFDLPLACG